MEVNVDSFTEEVTPAVINFFTETINQIILLICISNVFKQHYNTLWQICRTCSSYMS